MSLSSLMQWPSFNGQRRLIGPGTLVAPKLPSTIFPSRKACHGFDCHATDGGCDYDDDVATESSSSSHSRDGAYPPCSNIFLPHHTTRHIRIEELTRPIFTVWPRSTSKYFSLYHAGNSRQPVGYLKCERLLGGSTSILLMDERQESIALCLSDTRRCATPSLDHHRGSQTFVLYSRSPMANCGCADDFNGNILDVVRHNGSLFYPCLRIAIPECADARYQPEIQLWDQTGEGSKCGISCCEAFDIAQDAPISSPLTSMARILQQHNGQTWNATVHPGADPVLMICLTAILERFER
jgi:hypothetical protein